MFEYVFRNFRPETAPKAGLKGPNTLPEAPPGKPEIANKPVRLWYVPRSDGSSRYEFSADFNMFGLQNVGFMWFGDVVGEAGGPKQHHLFSTFFLGGWGIQIIDVSLISPGFGRF